MKIAIVDDRIESQQILAQYIQKNASKMDRDVEITCFNDGIELIDRYQSSFDIIYLDVEMAIMDGMTTAKKIRQTDSEVLIVFVTNHAQVAIQGYSVEAVDFLLKPLNPFTFEEHFKKIVRKVKRVDDAVLVKVSGTVKRVNQSSILYLESQGHYIDFVTDREKFTLIDSMKNLEAKLDATRFYRCNNSYIINFEHVDHIDKSAGVAYIGEHAIQISRARKKECVERFTQYLGRQML
ncbi:response regulator transcription factor [Tuanshanicoccus lijuaniae]|uniref:LytR/AlgR family response regulator transcription factor n=1 Tax=Aerococcaceae bacterium zg-1292 TaxID=2774330 RepID=UPI001937955C|nr:response regulator transcription factor [Aerococcaceae bacterium zg-1292]QQA36707.1 response regulator transcription factor [Aerococcaceae bacterium zg-1292]